MQQGNDNLERGEGRTNASSGFKTPITLGIKAHL